MKKISIEAGTVLVKSHYTCKSFYIVENGELEAYIDLDGEKFILELFPMGTVINSRSLITNN